MRPYSAQSSDSAASIRALVMHHLHILQRRFPDYRHVLNGPPYWIQVYAPDEHGGNAVIIVSFFSGHLHILINHPPGHVGGDDTVYYADPKLTDDFLSEIVENVELDNLAPRIGG